MSDKPISVGDLVVVVKPGCTDKYLGYTYRVSRITTEIGPCMHCGGEHGSGPLVCEHPKIGTGGFRLSRLKRIPPPEELGIVDEKTEEPSYVG